MILLIPSVALADEKHYYSECNGNDSFSFCIDGWYNIKEFSYGNNNHYMFKSIGYWKFYINNKLIGKGKINVQRNSLTREEVKQILKMSNALIDFNENTICFFDTMIKYSIGEVKFIKNSKMKCNGFKINVSLKVV